LRLLTRLASIGAAIALLSACSAIHAATQGATDSFHSSFRASFKSSFVKACTGQGASEKLCGCVEATLERDNTDDQLMKMTADSKETNKQLAAATKACAQK
jgi:uncharacterized membrane protein